MNVIEQFAELNNFKTVAGWRNHVFKLAQNLGYERSLLAIFPDHNTPVESEYAFLHTSYPEAWLNRYNEDKFGLIDPVVSHCSNKSVPLIWTPPVFTFRRQKELYEEACGYGIRSGVTLPIHGGNREFGVLCFVSDMLPNKRFQEDAARNIPELSCLRDFVFESSRRFTKKLLPEDEKIVPLTNRELECLKWCAAGKSTWDISQLLRCSEASVNFHFCNIRRKLHTPSRRLAAIKALRLGIINLP